MSTLLDAAVRRQIETRLRALRPDSARQWGRMSPHQTLCHLSDAFRMAVNERAVAPIAGGFKPIVKFIALRLPLAWPKGRIRTIPEADQGKDGTPPVEFEADRAELLALISRFCDAGPGGRCATHPLFGSMNDDLWGRWAYRHMDLHLRQFGL